MMIDLDEIAKRPMLNRQWLVEELRLDDETFFPETDEEWVVVITQAERDALLAPQPEEAKP